MKPIYIVIFAFLWPICLFTYFKANLPEYVSTMKPVPFDGTLESNFLLPVTPEPASSARPIDGIYPAAGANATIYAGPNKTKPAIVVDQESANVHLPNALISNSVQSSDGSFDNIGVAGAISTNTIDASGNITATKVETTTAKAEGGEFKNLSVGEKVISDEVDSKKYKYDGKEFAAIRLYGVPEGEEVNCYEFCRNQDHQVCIGVIYTWSPKHAAMRSECGAASNISHCACIPYWPICERQGDCREDHLN